MHLRPGLWFAERIDMYVCSHLFLAVAVTENFQDTDTEDFAKGAAVM